jgi:hypothetical protein
MNRVWNRVGNVIFHKIPWNRCLGIWDCRRINNIFTYLYFVFLTMKKFGDSKNCSRWDKSFYLQLAKSFKGTVSRNGCGFLSFYLITVTHAVLRTADV